MEKKKTKNAKWLQRLRYLAGIVVIENEENLNNKTKISAKAAGTGGSRLGLHKDDEVSIKDLLYGLMLCSR